MTTTTTDTPVLTEPTSESLAAGATIAVPGSYVDAYGPSHPGSMYVEVIVKNGTVSATDTAGHAVAGSGTSAIELNTDYATINAVLGSLTYTASAGGGSDSIHMEVWNQLGIDRPVTIPVTITGGTGISSGTGSGNAPVLAEPSSVSLSAGATAAVAGSYTDSVAASGPGTMYINLTAGSGTLSATDLSGATVTGSGTGQITLTTDYADVQAVLRSLTYSAGASDTGDTIHYDLWNQWGTETTGSTAVTVAAAGSGGGSGSGSGSGTGSGSGGGGSGSGSTTPVLTTPASASVTAGSSIAVASQYADSFAQANSGAMLLTVSADSGTVSATDASGVAVTGSGTHSITAHTDFVDVNAILQGLHYAAAGSAGTDTIHFDLWDQAGVETTGSIAVTVNAAASQSTSAVLADLAPTVAGSAGAVLPSSGTTTQAGLAMLSTPGTQPIGVPLSLHG